jgi:hypothetical protein
VVPLRLEKDGEAVGELVVDDSAELEEVVCSVVVVVADVDREVRIEATVVLGPDLAEVDDSVFEEDVIDFASVVLV